MAEYPVSAAITSKDPTTKQITSTSTSSCLKPSICLYSPKPKEEYSKLEENDGHSDPMAIMDPAKEKFLLKFIHTVKSKYKKSSFDLYFKASDNQEELQKIYLAELRKKIMARKDCNKALNAMKIINKIEAHLDTLLADTTNNKPPDSLLINADDQKQMELAANDSCQEDVTKMPVAENVGDIQIVQESNNLTKNEDIQVTNTMKSNHSESMEIKDQITKENSSVVTYDKDKNAQIETEKQKTDSSTDNHSNEEEFTIWDLLKQYHSSDVKLNSSLTSTNTRIEFLKKYREQQKHLEIELTEDKNDHDIDNTYI